ncbi:MAG TPA: hypothetical protein VII06_43110 [Chloroflexota bacterium]
MANPRFLDTLAREIAATDLHLAARRYAITCDLVHAGDASQEVLRARQRALEDAALVYAATVAEEGGDGDPAA